MKKKTVKLNKNGYDIESCIFEKKILKIFEALCAMLDYVKTQQ